MDGSRREVDFLREPIELDAVPAKMPEQLINAGVIAQVHDVLNTTTLKFGITTRTLLWPFFGVAVAP